MYGFLSDKEIKSLSLQGLCNEAERVLNLSFINQADSIQLSLGVRELSEDLVKVRQGKTLSYKEVYAMRKDLILIEHDIVCRLVMETV